MSWEDMPCHAASATTAGFKVLCRCIAELFHNLPCFVSVSITHRFLSLFQCDDSVGFAC